MYLPNTNTNTNTTTQTNTNTLTRFNTNTNTNTSTVTNTSTSTSTNTATNTVTQTFGDDANADGFLQVSEIPLDGTGGDDFLDTDPNETTYNYDTTIDQIITQDIVQGDSTLSFYNPESGLTTFGDGNLIEQEISQDVWLSLIHI